MDITYVPNRNRADGVSGGGGGGVGPQGPQGIQGPPGDPGPAGDAGSQGGLPEVENNAEMQALGTTNGATLGFLCYRSDLQAVYQLRGNGNPVTLVNWVDIVANATAPTSTNGMSTGAGTSHNCTSASARIVFGTTQPDVALPTAGTYLVVGLCRVQPGANAGDDYRFKLHNVTATADISAETALPSVSGEDMSMVAFAIVTIATPSTIVQFIRNAGQTRGVVASAVTYTAYMRLA